MRLSRRRSPCTHLLPGIALCVVGAAAVADPPTAAIFGALPAQTAPVLSPDGHYVAWVEPKEPKWQVIIFDLEAHKVQRTVSAQPKSLVKRLDWSDGETLLMTVSGPVGDRVIAQTVSGATPTDLVSPFSYVVSAHVSKPNTIITATVSNISTSSKDTHLLEVDTVTGKEAVIKVGDKHTVRWVVDRDGHPLAREDWDWWKHQYRVYALSGDSVREILHRDDDQRPIVGGALPGSSALLLLAANGRTHQAAWALPLDGSPLQLLAEDPGADISDVYVDPYSGAVIGVYVSGAETSTHWLDPAAKARYESLVRAFPSRLVEPYSWTQDGKRMLARVSSVSSPPVFYLVDFRTHHADIAAEEYPGLAGAALAEMKDTTYKARDGTEIPAYLTLPPGNRTLPLPLVVLPHGGPHTRDYPRFDALVQFMATHGYAVLQPQFRGSTGFGDAYRDAGDRQWGGLMQDDLTDGVRALVAQGVVDPRRVCIVGTSGYSGYAALAGAAFTPDVYACAVSINGISDLGVVIKETFAQGPFFNVISTNQSVAKKEFGGYFDSRRVSPINGVSSVKIPILIMYGANPYVAVMQSQSMARALAKAGKDVTVVTLPADAEWQVRTASRVGVFQEIERFLNAHLQVH